jgi:hypothetical protein
MKVIDLSEAKSKLENYARECQATPVVVTIDGKPTFEMLPIRSDDPDFIDRLLISNPDFRNLMERRRQEASAGKVSTLKSVRENLGDSSAS